MSAKSTLDPVDIRMAGIKALIAALGRDQTQTFLMTFNRTDDFTAERHEWPETPRTVGLKVLTAALGQEGRKAFLMMFSGTGNFTAERHEWPETPHEEVVAGINKLQEEGMNAGVAYEKSARAR